MARPASERGPDGAVESAEAVYTGRSRFNLGNVFDDRREDGIVEDRREHRDESRLFNLEKSELPSASVHFGRGAPALARRGRS
jgi:hypothetical protein